MRVAFALQEQAALSCALCSRRSQAGITRRSAINRRISRASVHTEANHDAGNSNAENAGPQSAAAAHILAQARIEEADLSPTAGLSARLLESQKKEIPWQGEESIEDAVLRMLMDKYKPLRVPGTVRKIQQPSDEPVRLPEAPKAPRIMTASGDVDQSAPGYQWQEGDPPRFPWEHTFKSPADKDGKPFVKTGVLVRSTTPPSRSAGSLSHNKGSRPSAGDIAARVFRAKDASIDYASGSTDVAKAKAALGMRGRGNDSGLKAKASGGSYRPMPTSIRAWNNLVDEKIELARQQGLFKTVKGRGKPLVRDDHDSNPFIGRSEFLMNRIIKKQEAAPPFVELQREMRTELDGFRARLRANWIRRATRILSLQPLTPSVIDGSGQFRDEDWAAREKGYHENAVAAVNSMIRKYNMVAPQSVRMSITSVEAELALCYKDCEKLIKEELKRRSEAGLSGPVASISQPKKQRYSQGRTMEEQTAVRETMLSALRRLTRDIFSKGASQSV